MRNTKPTATAEIRRTDTGYVAVTRVGRIAENYPLPNDRADADAYARHFRTAGEAAGMDVSVRIDD
jgi:hypothetical protein